MGRIPYLKGGFTCPMGRIPYLMVGSVWTLRCVTNAGQANEIIWRNRLCNESKYAGKAFRINKLSLNLEQVLVVPTTYLTFCFDPGRAIALSLRGVEPPNLDT